MSESTNKTSFDTIREKLDFYLDEKGEPWAEFVAEDDKRRFPLQSLVIQAQLHAVVKDGGKPKEELEKLKFECVRHATKKYRSKQERDDDILEEDGLVLAILNMLARLKKDGHKPEFTGTIQELRTELLKGPPEERNAEVKKNGKKLIEVSDWPEAPHKFAIYLRARESVLASFRVKLTYKRTGTARLYSLKYTGGDSGIQHVQVTDPNGDLFEMLGLYDPKPTVTQDDAQIPPQASQAPATENAVTPGDAPGGPQASQPPVTQDDAKTASQASLANKEGKHLVERLPGSQEAGEKVLDEATEEEARR